MTPHNWRTRMDATHALRETDGRVSWVTYRAVRDERDKWKWLAICAAVLSANLVAVIAGMCVVR